MNKLIDSIYLHFPFCTHLCNYCDFYKKVPDDKTLDFISFHQYLDSAFLEHQQLMKTHGYSFAPFKTFYIGGGTPSFWGKDGKIFLENFMQANNLSLDENCEFTMEVNPGAWTEEALDEWQKLGANRFSLGIQTLNPQLLKFLDRSHPENEILRTLKYFSDNKLNFSVDFMLGLPNSENLNRNIIEELEFALKFNPSHFSIYILTVKENYKYYNQLPSEEWIEKEFIQVSDYLKKMNFIHYEVSNFALPQKESKHNLKYWKSETVSSLGPSAVGFLKEVKLRYKWKSNIPAYEAEILNEQEILMEEVYLKLRTRLGLSRSMFNDSIGPLIEKWKKSGLIDLDDDLIIPTSRGFLLLDSIMDDLFKIGAI